MSTGAFTLADIDRPKQQKGEFSVADIDQMPPAPAKTSLNASPKAFTLPWFKQEAVNFAEGATKSLPAIGATLGGLAGFAEGGPVGSVGGAGIGGMGGEAAKQLLRRGLFGDGPYSPREAASDITKEGVIQGAVQAGTEAMPFLAAPLRRAATVQYERALAPTTKINKAITQKIVPGMIQRGVKGSLGSIEQRAGEEAANVGPQLDAAYANAPGATGTGAGPNILKDLDNLKGQYTVKGIPANDTAINAINGVQAVVKRFGNDIDPDSLRALKSIFDDPVAKAGGYAGADLSTKYTLEAQEAAANSIRKIMAQASPDVAELNKQMSFWLNVQKVAKDSGLRQTGQAGGLMKVLAPLGTGVAGSVGYLAHGAPGSIEAGSIAALTALTAQIVRSPAYRTMTAVTKDRLAGALARGDVGEISAFASRIGIAATGMSTQGSRPNQMPIPQPIQ